MRRGLALNIVSNLVFFISSYCIHYYLGSTVPAASYGVVGTIITVLDFEYMFVSNGARQSLSAHISSRNFDIADLIRKTIAFQCLIVVFFFLVNFIGSPVFADIFHDDSLQFYFKLAAFLIPANGFYVVVLGINDGLQRFGHSAFLSTIYPIFKLGVIPLIIFLFPHDPVSGVELGYLLAMVATIIIGLILLIPLRHRFSQGGNERIHFSVVAQQTLSFSFFFIMVSIVLSLDTLVVKAVVEPDSMAGYYTGAMNFGKTSYYLLQAFAVVILPIVSRLVSANKRREALGAAQELVLIAFAFVLPLAMIISSTSGSLLATFYHPSYDIAAPALTFLAPSSFFMGMTVVLNMVINIRRSNHFSDILSIVSLIIVIPMFIVSARFGGITYLALSSMVCTCIAMIISYLKARRSFGNMFTSTTWKVIAINCGIWIVLFAVTHLVTIRSLPELAVLYAAVYAGYLICMVKFGVVKPSSLLAAMHSKQS
ncbi:lipopolysaccharide biosynthesis protein [Bifidobacterium aquikefiricola]|uniref:Oligosaccharide flippase family protein n=1 Tax=Bifidobacterium aquikefiricola TaxID=3059038 RepID=A0AB39U600_9BIFI